MLALLGGVTSGSAGRKHWVDALAWCAVGRHWLNVGTCWHKQNVCTATLSSSMVHGGLVRRRWPIRSQ